MSARNEASGAVAWSRVRTPRIASILAKAMVAAGLVSHLVFGPLDTLFIPCFLAAIVLGISSYALSLTQANEPGTVEVRGTELVVTYGATQRVMPHADVVSALVVERKDSFGNVFACVDVEMKHGDRITFTAREPQHVHAIVDALGFGAGGRRQRATITQPTRRLIHPLLAVLVYCAALAVEERLPIPGEVLLPLLCFAVYELVKLIVRPTVLVAGNDAFAIRRALRTTFVPRSDIAAVEEPANGPPVILTYQGWRITLGAVGWDADRVRALARTIRDRGATDDAAGDHVADYARNGLPVSEWRKRLEGRSMHEDYRSPPATTDGALGVLRSAHATPEQRVGAAIAARGAGVPRERLRVAAEATVEDRVRVALEAVADDEDDAVIERAMKRLSR